MFKLPGHADLAGTEARAVSASLVWGDRVEDHAPTWPVGALSYSFDLDDDLAKLVTVQTVPGGLEIDVQYGRDYVLRRDRYSMRLVRPPVIRRSEWGVTVQTTRPLLPWFNWPRWRLTYRF